MHTSRKEQNFPLVGDGFKDERLSPAAGENENSMSEEQITNDEETPDKPLGRDDLLSVKFSAFCYYEITDDLQEFPGEIYPSREDCIDGNTSYHGHDCDDPEKRGVIAECEIEIKIPKMIESNDAIREYISHFRGSPAIMVVGDAEYNKKLFKEAIAEQRRQLDILG